MRTLLPLACAGFLVASAGAALAQPHRPHHRHPPAASVAAYSPAGSAYGRRGGFNAGAAQVPPQGFYDGYEGPGSTVLKRGLAAQNEPGAAEELAPGAKQTATGGPVGGLPGFGGGM